MSDISICDPEDFAELLKETAQQFTDEVVDYVEGGITEIANDALREVKSLSPEESGAYKKGWTTTTEKKNGTITVRIHNKKYMLVHLLELGHLLKDGTGRIYGEVSPRVHVETAEKHADEKVERLLEELANGT